VAYGPFSTAQAKRLSLFLRHYASAPIMVDGRPGRLVITADDQAQVHIEAMARAIGADRLAPAPETAPKR
jgi:hypothetical protein